MAPPSSRPEPARKLPAARLLLLLPVVVAAVVLFVVLRDRGGAAPGDALDAGVAAVPVQTRCERAAGGDGFLIGETSSAQPLDPEAELDAGDDEEPLGLVPFAPELGRAAVLPDGFAVGVKRVREGGAFAEIAIVDGAGRAGRLVALARSRGDIDAPLVIARGEGLVAAMVEPNAGGLSLRVASIEGQDVTWGAELAQGRDESLAFDMAVLPGGRIAVVWDELDAEERSRIMLAVLDDELAVAKRARAVSPAGVDAELPRLLSRDGGLWLAYVARRPPKAPAAPGDRVDGRYAAEAIEPSWLEAALLDEQGEVQGEPQAMTPKDRYVLAFDLAQAPEGGLLVSWSDGDAPSGGHGGQVRLLRLGQGGDRQEQAVALEDVGSGVPVLLDRWIALPGEQVSVRLAPLGADGSLAGPLRVEPAARAGQVLAGRGDAILVAQPAGAAVVLDVLRCDASRASEDLDAGAAADAEPPDDE